MIVDKATLMSIFLKQKEYQVKQNRGFVWGFSLFNVQK